MNRGHIVVVIDTPWRFGLLLNLIVLCDEQKFEDQSKALGG